jgi:hypothetical protein
VVTTNAVGVYSVTSLPVGHYTATFDSPGFDTLKFEKLALEVGETRVLNVVMQLGGIKTEITVRELAPDLDQTTAAIGSVIEASQTQDLPLNGRSWVRLLTLVPGAIDAASSTEDQVRFVGMSQEDNNFRFDGVDATGINHQ